MNQAGKRSSVHSLSAILVRFLESDKRRGTYTVLLKVARHKLSTDIIKTNN